MKPRHAYHLLRKISHWSKLLFLGAYVVGSCTNLIEKFPQAASCATDLLVLPFVPYVNDAILSASPTHRDRITEKELTSLTGQIAIKLNRPLDEASFHAICIPKLLETCTVNPPGVSGFPEWDGFGSQPEGIVKSATIINLVPSTPLVVLGINSSAVGSRLSNQPCFDFTYFLRGSGGVGAASIGTTDKPLKIQVDGGTREVGPFLSTVTVCKPTGDPPSITAAGWIDVGGQVRPFGDDPVPPHAPIVFEFSRPLAWSAPVMQSLTTGAENLESRFEMPDSQRLVIAPNDGRGFEPGEQNQITFPRKTTLRTFNSPPSTVSEDGQQVVAESLPTFTSGPLRIHSFSGCDTDCGSAIEFSNTDPTELPFSPPYGLHFKEASRHDAIKLDILRLDGQATTLATVRTGDLGSSGTIYMDRPGNYLVTATPQTIISIFPGQGYDPSFPTTQTISHTPDFVRISPNPPLRTMILPTEKPAFLLTALSSTVANVDRNFTEITGGIVGNCLLPTMGIPAESLSEGQGFGFVEGLTNRYGRMGKFWGTVVSLIPGVGVIVNGFFIGCKAEVHSNLPTMKITFAARDAGILQVHPNGEITLQIKLKNIDFTGGDLRLVTDCPVYANETLCNVHYGEGNVGVGAVQGLEISATVQPIVAPGIDLCYELICTDSDGVSTVIDPVFCDQAPPNCDKGKLTGARPSVGQSGDPLHLLFYASSTSKISVSLDALNTRCSTIDDKRAEWIELIRDSFFGAINSHGLIGELLYGLSDASPLHESLTSEILHHICPFMGFLVCPADKAASCPPSVTESLYRSLSEMYVDPSQCDGKSSPQSCGAGMYMPEKKQYKLLFRNGFFLPK